MSIDRELALDTVERMVDARTTELHSLAESHGMDFAASVMLSACAHVAGIALATCKDESARREGGRAFITAMAHTMRKTGAEFEAIDAIQKAMS